MWYCSETHNLTLTELVTLKAELEALKTDVEETAGSETTIPQLELERYVWSFVMWPCALAL